MVTGDDLAFVRLAMRRRLVSAQRIREAVERKKWDSKDRTIAEILVSMGAIDPNVVKKLASEIGVLGRQTVSSGGQRDRVVATVVSRKTDPSLEKSEPSAVAAPADERTEADEPKAKIPRRVGRYEVVRLIGAGAMGAVYEARDRELDRTIALKLLAGEGAPSARAIARFRREAKLAARLDHPNIVRVYGAGFEDNHHFIAMDLVDGRSLAELVAIGEVPPRRAIHLARKIAIAMEHAHERGVLHRDLKPANVLVDENGEPRVTDFGLAVLSEPEENDRLTRTGAAVGTPAYMSPEQARGDLQDIDPRSDVYALGATLYEMLTGGPPFEAPTFLELAKKICEAEPPSPRIKNPECPEDLETICLKALEKEKEDRYSSAAEMAADLGRLIEDAPIVAKPPSAGTRAKRWATRHPGIAATIVALVLLNIAGGIRFYLQPGYVTVFTVPAGAKVYIDGAYVGTHVQEHPLLAGKHELRFGLENYDATATRLDVDRGHNAPTIVRLVHDLGTLSLRASRALEGATVTIRNPHNGEVVATQLAPFDKLVKPGDYVLTAKKAGFVSSEPIALKIEKGAVHEVFLPELAPEKVSLQLEVEPRGAELRLEGSPTWQVATDGLVTLKREGGFDIELRKPGFLPRTLTARVPRETRKRATLAPLRASSRPLGGIMVAAPVVADVDGDGAPDVLLLEHDEEGRWLTLLGGGEEGPRWRVRPGDDARAILELLADVDQDGILDVAVETRTGVTIRDGAYGSPILSLPVAPAVGDAPPEGAVRSAQFRTRSGQGVRSMAVLALRYGAGEVVNLRIAVWVDGAGYSSIATSCPELRAEQEGSAPIVVPIGESMGGEVKAQALFVALKGKVARLDLPLVPSREAAFLHAKTYDVKESTGKALLASVTGKGGEMVLLCPESGPLVAIDPASGKIVARFGTPASRLDALQVVPLEKGWQGVLVRDSADASNPTTRLLRWSSIRSEFRDDGVELLRRDEPLFLPQDALWAPRRREEPTFWARGHVLDLRGNELRDRSGEAHVWARDGHNAVADLDGSGAQQVLAASIDGRSLITLAPVSVLRWRAPAPGFVDATVGELDGEKALVAIGRDGIVALAASDGRTLWHKPAPPGARSIALMKTKKGRDVLVLGDKLVRRLDGRDGSTVWEQAAAPASRTIQSLGEDACGCGEDDVVLGDPVAFLSGGGKAGGKVLKALGGATPAGAPALGPLVLEGEKGKHVVIARLGAGEGAPCELLKLTPVKEGWNEDWRIPVNASTGPLAPLAAVTSGVLASLVLAEDNRLMFLSPEKRPVGEAIEVGQVLAARAPSPPDHQAPIVVVSGEQRQGQEIEWFVRAIVRQGEGGEVAWARRLPAGRRPPSAPVFLDHGGRVAVLAPSGSIVILSAKDGSWLGERRIPEGEIESLVAGYDLPEAGGATLVALTNGGALVAFDGATKSGRVQGDVRVELCELSRRVKLGRAFAMTVANRLSQNTWENSAPAQYVLAQAHLALGDTASALRAVDTAIRLAGRHPAAQALRIKVLVHQSKAGPLDGDALLAALGALVADRPELAAKTALELAETLAEDDDRIDSARKLVELVVHALPTEPNARRLKVRLMLRRMAETENDTKLAEKDRLRQIQWLREDTLIALTSPKYSKDPELRALAAIAAYTLAAYTATGMYVDDAEFRVHARQVSDAVGMDLLELEKEMSSTAWQRYENQVALLAKVAQKRPKWSGLVTVTKRSVAKRQQRDKDRADKDKEKEKGG